VFAWSNQDHVQAKSVSRNARSFRSLTLNRRDTKIVVACDCFVTVDFAGASYWRNQPEGNKLEQNEH
jgi:hypothetical protein